MDEDKEFLAADIEDGTYFKAGRGWHSELFHSPMGQRSYYIIVIFLALVNLYFALLSFSEVFPLQAKMPFVTFSSDIWEELPRIHRIRTSDSEDKNEAVMKFLVKSYTQNREAYDLPLFELRYRNIWSQSTKDVFEQYKAQIDAASPSSFYQMYTNRFRRAIYIDSISYENTGNNDFVAHVTFEASIISLTNNEETANSVWRADIKYKYSNFYIDQSLEHYNGVARFFGLTGDSLKTSGEKRKSLLMKFVVSDYKVKELLE